MAFTYVHDSPGKKWARVQTWHAIEKELGKPRFLAGPHLVLSGPEAADARFLVGGGVPPHRVVAIDREADVLAAAKVAVPGVTFRLCDVKDVRQLIAGLPGKTFENGQRGFASAFLDFTGPLSHHTMDAVCAVVSFGLLPGAVLAMNVLRGREIGKYRDAVESAHKHRIVAASYELFQRPELRHHWMLPLGVITYESYAEDKPGGCPMYTMFFVHQRDALGRHGKKRQRAYSKAAIETFDRGFTHETPKSLRSTEWMKALAVECRDVPAQAMGAYLNVPPGRVAAWRAWDTIKEQKKYEEKGDAS